MGSKPSQNIPKFSLVFPTKPAFVQAWNLFVFSSIFAVLFNTFYSDGIELKYKPPKSLDLTQVIKNSAPQTFTGWKSTPAKTSKAVAPTTPSPLSRIPRLSLIGAKTRFDQKNCIFLDARNPEHYQEAHIPGALNFPAIELDKFAPLVMPQLTDKHQEIVCYCDGGDCTLSLELAQMLIEQGYQRVEVFEGGWPAWKKAAYPTHTGELP